MKSLMLLLSILSLTMAACQPKTEVIREVVGNEKPVGQSEYDGGTHSGGDNGVDGKNMEDYAINVHQEQAFRQFVLPIILKVAQTHPRFASDMIHITNERTWYIVPVALKSLRASQVGLSFADETIQQFALQNLRAVWINQKHYGNFPSDESRARLILHEILMGVRLMKLKSSLDNCYSGLALLTLDSGKSEDYQKGREQCALTYMFKDKDATDSPIPGLGTSLNLKAHDYDSIRELGVNLWTSGGVISKAELDAWLKVNDFRSY